MFHYLGTSSGALGANGINTPTFEIYHCLPLVRVRSFRIGTNELDL
jgi:hypothetical protein